MDSFDPTDYLSARQQGEAFERAVLKSLGPAEPELIETESEIPMRDGHRHPIRITKPAYAPEGGSPLVICFHGGGFMAGVCLGSMCSGDILRISNLCRNADSAMI